jgi:hypothetical protein
MISLEDLLGIQRSGPSFLDISCDGISASRNATLNTVLPGDVSESLEHEGLLRHTSVVIVRRQVEIVKQVIGHSLG